MVLRARVYCLGGGGGGGVGHRHSVFWLNAGRGGGGLLNPKPASRNWKRAREANGVEAGSVGKVKAS